MKVLKKIGVSVALLVIGIVLGALLFGPVDIVQGQGLPGQFFAVALPPSPCNVAVQSRIVTAEDGTATARLIAYPPSPCTSLNLEISQSVPENTASCMEVVSREQAKAAILDCTFDAGHQYTIFSVNATASE